MTKPQKIIVLIFSLLLAVACFVIGSDTSNAFLALIAPLVILGSGLYLFFSDYRFSGESPTSSREIETTPIASRDTNPTHDDPQDLEDLEEEDLTNLEAASELEENIAEEPPICSVGGCRKIAFKNIREHSYCEKHYEAETEKTQNREANRAYSLARLREEMRLIELGKKKRGNI